MGNEEIIRKYFSLLERVKREYFFLNLSNKDYREFVDKAINISKDELCDKDDYLLYSYLKDNLSLLLKQETGRRLIQDSLKVLNSYFNQLEMDTSSYEAFKKTLDNVFNFLSTYNVKLTSEVVDFLLKSNPKAYLFTKKINEYLLAIKLTSLGKDFNLNTMLFSYYLIDESSLEIKDFKDIVYSKEEVRKRFLNLIDSFKKKYAFLEIKDVDSLIDKVIDESIKESNSKDDFNRILENDLERFFREISKRTLQRSRQVTLEKYFNSLEIDVSSFGTFSKNLKKILYFLKKNGVVLTGDEAIYLVKNNEVVKLLGASIYQYFDLLKKSILGQDENVLVLMSAYYREYKDSLELETIQEKSIYESYKEYTHQEIDKAIRMLSWEEINLLRERYDLDGNLKEGSKSSKKIDIILRKVISKNLEEVVREEKENVIYDLFPNREHYLIDMALKKLPLAYQSKIKILENAYYSKEAKAIMENEEFREIIYPKIVAIVVNLTNFYISDFEDQRSLKEIFKDYSDSQLRRVISYLSVQEKNLLRLKYNFNNFEIKNNYQGLSTEDAKALDILIKERLTSLLKREKEMMNISVPERLSSYPKDKILALVVKLSREKQALFYLCYNENLEVKEIYESLDYLTKRKVNNLLNKLISKLESNDTRRAKNFYERLRGYSKEEVDAAITCLTQEAQTLYHLYHDANGDLVDSFYGLDNDSKRKVRMLRGQAIYFAKKNRENLNGKQKKKLHLGTLYELLANYSKDEVDVAIKELAKKDQRILALRFDEAGNTKESYRDLDRKDKQANYHIIKKIGIIIDARHNKAKMAKRGPKVKMAKRGPKVKNFYKRFKGFGKDEINLRITWLSLENQRFLRSVYDEDGNPTSKFADLSKQELLHIIYLVQMIKRYLKPKNTCKQNDYRRTKNFYERFKGYTKEEIDAEVRKLSSKELQFLAGIYNENGKVKVGTLDRTKQRKLGNLIQKLKKKLENSKVNIEDYTEKGNLKLKNFYDNFKYDSETVLIVKRKLPISYQELLNYVYGVDGNVRISSEEITADVVEKIEFIINNMREILGHPSLNEYNKKITYFVKTNKVLNEVNTYLNGDLLMIIIMKYGDLIRNYSDEEIVKMTKYSLEEVGSILELFKSVYQESKNKQMSKDKQKTLVLKRQ